MSRRASIGIAILNGLLGMFAAGSIALLAVDWYRIPGREGESGYFVVMLAMAGFGAGAFIGWLVARIARARGKRAFRALVESLGIVVLIAAVSGGLARALADVPPRLGGETMLLAVEIRWPENQIEPPVAVGSDEAYVALHSIPHFSHTVRASERGPLWMEDARRVDGRWFVPGAVEVFTSRGTRMLTVNTGEENPNGFEVPLRAFPKAKDLEWSDWLPRFRVGVTPPPGSLSFRFRVVRANEPIRTETIGPFAVATIANGFYEVEHDGRKLTGASAQFAVRHRGAPIVVDAKIDGMGDSTERVDHFDNVALITSSRAALVLSAGTFRGTGQCFLAAEDGDRLRVEHLSECGAETLGDRLSNDTAVFHASGKRKMVRGRIDRASYAETGFFRFGRAVLDTRQLVVHRFNTDTTITNNAFLAPFGFSPDQRSFVTYATTDSSPPSPLVVVTDFIANRTYTLPIDRARMRYAKVESLDPAWLDHHFVWQRGRDGVDRLRERPNFVPIPYHGELSTETGGNRTYRLDNATEDLRGALIEFIVKEFDGSRQPADSGAYEIPVKIGARVVNVAYSSGSSNVSVSMDRGDTHDSSVIAVIAQRFDAVLATGRYDRLFIVK